MSLTRDEPAIAEAETTSEPKWFHSQQPQKLVRLFTLDRDFVRVLVGDAPINPAFGSGPPQSEQSCGAEGSGGPADTLPMGLDVSGPEQTLSDAVRPDMRA